MPRLPRLFLAPSPLVTVSRKCFQTAMSSELSLTASSQPKKKNEAKPKSATAAPKAATAAKTAAGAAGKKGRRGRNAGRPKRKTAEELDADMTDYFNAGAAPAPAAAAAPAPAAVSTADEVAMEEL